MSSPAELQILILMYNLHLPNDTGQFFKKFKYVVFLCNWNVCNDGYESLVFLFSWKSVLVTNLYLLTFLFKQKKKKKNQN